MTEDDFLDRDPTLRDYLRVLRRRKLVVVVTILVCLGVAVAYTLVRTPTYAAVTDVLVPRFGTPNLSDPAAPSDRDPTTLQNYVEGEAIFAEGDAVRAMVSNSLGYKAPKISVKPIPDTQILLFTARDSDRHRAADIANDYANGYLQQRQASNKAQNDEYVKELEEQITTLQHQQRKYFPTDPRYGALNGQIGQLQQAIATLNANTALGDRGAVTKSAKPPGSPETPKLTLDLIIGGVLGILIGIGLAFLVDRLDDRIKSKRDLETATGGLTTLALVPQVKEWSDATESRVVLLSDPHSPAAEAYGTLRTSLQIYGRERPLGLIAVTSAKAGEGKTATVANLGVAFARAGQRVVTVCCDLRRARLHAYLGGSNARGFTSVVLGDVPLTDALQSVDVVPGLWLLAAGPPPPNPAELLASPASRAVFDELRREFDVVLVDCTPVLPVPDAIQLSTVVDGMILVTGARKANRRELARAVEILGQVDAPLVGTVLNQVVRADVEEGYSDYTFGYAPDTAPASSPAGHHLGVASPPSAPGGNGSVTPDRVLDD